jgi:hypothetical protein
MEFRRKYGWAENLIEKNCEHGREYAHLIQRNHGRTRCVVNVPAMKLRRCFQGYIPNGVSALFLSPAQDTRPQVVFSRHAPEAAVTLS